MCNCSYCNKIFEVEKYRGALVVNGKKEKIYCSIECKSKDQRTGRAVECENCGKSFYKRGYLIDKNKHHTCSNECNLELRYKLSHELRECPICHKGFETTKKSTKKLCSIECKNEYAKTVTGLKNSRSNGDEFSCEVCSKKIYRKKSRIEKSEHFFCSNECRQKWFAEDYSQTEETSRRSREVILKAFSDGKMSNLNSAPQIATNEILDSLGIAYEREKKCGHFAVDNYLTEYDLVIEVMGDYWHCNPNVFERGQHPHQTKRIGQDRAKHSYLGRYRNISVLYLWESDLSTNRELCEALILKYIGTGGQLEDYESFNYHLEDGELTLNSKIITPYRIAT